MDITRFVVSGRDQALLYGDHGTYQRQLGKKLLNSRKKLNMETKRRGKFQKKDEITAKDIGENHEYLRLLLLTSERAWAQAMAMKTAHAADSSGLTGRTRSHIVSRLDKAARTAEHLADELADAATSGASPTDVLEARAYAALTRGAACFERHGWEACIRSYSVAYLVYSALSTDSKGDVYRDLVSETIDPSIRYAAYQLKTPRTIPVPVIARKAFPSSDEALVREINQLDPNILKQGGPNEARKGAAAAENAPKTLTWRSREVRIEDAAIAIAWGAIQSGKAGLAEKLGAAAGSEPKEVAAAYDDVLTASQDAIDATKQAVDELKGEGVSASDPRMQSLQITWTAVNYEMISWRVGRNRVLTGDHDGALEEVVSVGTATKRKGKKAAAQESTPIHKRAKDLTPGRRIAKLKEKVALYDSTLQSLESVKTLPGIPADAELSKALEATIRYFTALKVLSIARSHSIVDQDANALALIKNAVDTFSPALEVLSPSNSDIDMDGDITPKNLHVSPPDAAFLAKLLTGELNRHRALVHIANLTREAVKKARAASADGPAPGRPLIDRLHDFPPGGVDLKNIVTFPPKLELVPVKPIFLDVAWNYIDYPRESELARGKPSAAKDAAKAEAKPAQPQKKGWFGFGR